MKQIESWTITVDGKAETLKDEKVALVTVKDAVQKGAVLHCVTNYVREAP